LCSYRRRSKIATYLINQRRRRVAVTDFHAQTDTNSVKDHPRGRVAICSLSLTEFALGKHIVDIAEKWGDRVAGSAEHRAVKSDIPTLILAGEFDQNTPSYWGKLAGETLNNSHYIEFPGAGHGVINNGVCALSVNLKLSFEVKIPWRCPSKCAGLTPDRTSRVLLGDFIPVSHCSGSSTDVVGKTNDLSLFSLNFRIKPIIHACESQRPARDRQL